MHAERPVAEVNHGETSALPGRFLDGAPDAQTPFRMRYAVWLLWASLVPLAYFTLRLVLFARTWPVVHDAAIMHYVVFMIGSGRAPYTGMVEMNLPGALMSEWFGMHVLGGNAAGLWRWDTTMGLLALAGGAWIAGRGRRLMGMAGVLFTWTIHLNDAAFDFAEREWLIAALWLLAIACAAEAIERREPRWMFGCLALTGWCCTIKPFEVLLPLALLVFVLRQLRPQWRGVLLWSALGVVPPVLAVVLYFAHWPGAFSAFLHTERTLGAWYGVLGRAKWYRMLFSALLSPARAALVLVIYMFVRMRGWLRCREALLAIGTVCGLLTYFAQRKSYPYHVYPFLVCAAVLGFVLAYRALAKLWPVQGLRGRDVQLAAVLFVLLCAFRMPWKFWHNHEKATYPYGTQQALIADLKSLGGHALSGHIQCMDMTLGGCIGAEYDLRLVQTTGFVNDYMLFPYPQSASPVLVEYQQRFLREMAANPPRVIVLTAHNWPNQDDRQFTKLGRWPEFGAWLAANYRLERTHLATTTQHTASYQIYERR
ncbi:hypothetical protein [Terriglobus sp.]|uniref:hypothetical protein n=1 Tax=Terriglobus sp. TaxID=1889013 RepID=UPI003AFFDF05